MEYIKKFDDIAFKKYKGKYFNDSWFNVIISDNANGFYRDDSGNLNTLFKFRKNVINQRLQDISIHSFLNSAKKKHSNRGLAGGINAGQKNARTVTKTGQNEGNYIASNIYGYYDRALREHRGKFPTEVVCRTTAFTLKDKELWESAMPFIEKCSNEYQRLSLKHFLIQQREYQKIKTALKIPRSVFTTITSNYNWRTACHCDSGDFTGGLGNLIVVGNDFTGGYLGFPQFKILIQIKPGDFLLMDSHQWHCNTKIKYTSPDAFRLSFVMYIRDDMSKCKTRKLIGNTVYYT